MSPSLFCHNCGISDDIWEQNIDSERSQMMCSACGSDVVELVDGPSQSLSGNQAGHDQPHLGNITGSRSISGLIGPGRFFATFFNSMDRMGDELPQEWIDRLTSHLLDEHNPSAKPTSRRALDNLIEVIVRPQDAVGEPRTDEAFTCAGEPCSVCHDEFSVGEKVAELPCCHVCF